jgi:MmyB-like transcription regulator ligand binding domain
MGRGVPSAGFGTGCERGREFAAPELAEVRSGLEYILAQQEPFPAVVVDRGWNPLQANAGAVRLVEFLVGPLPPDVPVNLADAMVGPDVLRPFLVNWQAWSATSSQRRGQCRRRQRGDHRPAPGAAAGRARAGGSLGAGTGLGPPFPDPAAKRPTCSRSGAMAPTPTPASP